MARRILSWLVDAPASHLAGAAGLALGAAAGGGLYLRQQLLQGHHVCQAATEQLRSASLVHQLLGSSQVSRTGPVGGYVDASGGAPSLELAPARPRPVEAR